MKTIKNDAIIIYDGKEMKVHEYCDNYCPYRHDSECWASCDQFDNEDEDE